MGTPSLCQVYQFLPRLWALASPTIFMLLAYDKTFFVTFFTQIGQFNVYSVVHSLKSKGHRLGAMRNWLIVKRRSQTVLQFWHPDQRPLNCFARRKKRSFWISVYGNCNSSQCTSTRGPSCPELGLIHDSDYSAISVRTMTTCPPFLRHEISSNYPCNLKVFYYVLEAWMWWMWPFPIATRAH